MLTDPTKNLLVFLLASLFFTPVAAAELTPKDEPVRMLDAVGVDASRRASFRQGRAWDPGEDETLVKILHRLPDFSRMLTERWAFSWEAKERDAVAAEPGEWLGQFFRLRGTVLTLRRETLPAEAVRRFDFAEYYRLEVEADGVLMTIFTKTVPKAWSDKLAAGQSAVSIDEPGSAVAMFLKTGRAGQGGEKGEREALFYFAADRVAWHPETTLGRLGMDVGLLDLVQDRKPIEATEREPFYQLLAAVRRVKPGELIHLARSEQGRGAEGRQNWTDAASLFNEPEQMRGRLVLLTGTVRRAVRIEVQDEDLVERFGIRHYYELDLFTPDSQDNPVTVCVPDLPAGMPSGSGGDYREQVEVAGFFLKSWAFTSTKNAEKGGEHRQLAPLLIGAEPIWLPPPEDATSPWSGPIIAATAVFILFIIWYFLRRQAKADRAARLAAKRRRQDL